MGEKVENYQHLWDGTSPQWALLNVEPNGAEAKYLIVDTETRSAMIIEDDRIASQVIDRMLAAGVRIIADL